MNENLIRNGKCIRLEERLMSLHVDGGVTTFTELCDGHFELTVPNYEAIEILEQLIEHIKENQYYGVKCRTNEV